MRATGLCLIGRSDLVECAVELLTQRAVLSSKMITKDTLTASAVVWAKDGIDSATVDRTMVDAKLYLDGLMGLSDDFKWSFLTISEHLMDTMVMNQRSEHKQLA